MMIDKFTSYFKKLEGLSRDELVTSAKKLVLAENTNIAKLITHLAEMSARTTALELGYKSLYEYCITGLNLSEGAVPARIHVANVSRRFPQLLAALAESRISLTVAALLAPHLIEENVEKLLSDCAGMKRRETEEYVVAFRPKPVFEPSIRKRAAPPAQLEPPPTSTSPSPPPVETPKASPTILQPARPAVYDFRFSASRDFQEQVRASCRSRRHRERSEAHGRDFGEGAQHRAQEERPEEEARAAEKEAERRHGAISFKRDEQERRTGQISLRCLRSFRARPRTWRLSVCI